MEILRYISGPLIGAVIGYFTNYIAVKMLFYPRHEIKVFGHTLPFTPGAVPKGKARLANAAGKVVSDNLITADALKTQLLNERIENELADAVSENLSRQIRDELSLLTKLSREQLSERKIQISEILSNEIVRSIDIRPVVNEKGGEMIRTHIHGSVMKKIVSDKMIRSLTESIGNELQSMIERDGAGYVRPIVEKRISDAGDHTVMQFLGKINISEDNVRSAVISAYGNIVSEYSCKVIEKVDISGIVADKINEMSVDELERLVLEMMKNELGLIVDLGAVIGFIIGLLNLLIQYIV